MKDCYAVLGVQPTATQGEIKRAYKKLAMQYHPDRWAQETRQEQEDAQAEFKQIELAYRTLKDAVARAHYDTTGETAMLNPANAAMQKLVEMFHTAIANAIDEEMLRDVSTDESALLLRPISPIAKVLPQMYTNIRSDIKGIKGRMALFEARVKKLNNHKRSMLNKHPDRENIYLSVIEQKITVTSTALASLGLELITLNKVLELLNDYEIAQDTALWLDLGLI